MSHSVVSTVGPLLRSWRARRRLSQLELANMASVTTRHVSFVETNRSRPSREMVIHLAEHLEVPLRERNNLLLAAGYAPIFRETDFDAVEFRPVREALNSVLAGLQPYPAVAVDRHWQLVDANAAAAILIEGVAPALLEPPINVLRVSLHPQGLAPRIANLDEWAEHVMSRLHRQALVSGDGSLLALEQELKECVAADGVEPTPRMQDFELAARLATPLRLRCARGEVSLLSTITTFGTALDITLAELAVEAFLPADQATTDILADYAHPG